MVSELVRARPPADQAVAPALSVVIYLYDLAGGGIERLSLLLLEAFRRAGMTVTLALHRPAGELLPLVPPDARVVSFGKTKMAADVPTLRRLLRRERPDILLTSQHHNNLVALLAAAGTRTRVVVCQHNALSREAAELESWKYRIMPALYRVMLPLSGGIVAVSRGVADDLAAAARVSRDRITIVYNPVIDDGFAARRDEPLDDPWLDRPGPPVFVNAARLVPQKDHATLLRAFAVSLRRQPARLLILGKGPLLSELQALAAELGVAEQVRFAGFVVNPLPYFRHAAAVVLSSRYEGSGNVLIEAMACGTPVISTDCPHGPREIVESGRFGRLVPVADPGRLADALDPGLRGQFPPDMLERRAAAFSVHEAAARYQAVMERVAHRSGTPAG